MYLQNTKTNAFRAGTPKTIGLKKSRTSVQILSNYNKINLHYNLRNIANYYLLRYRILLYKDSRKSKFQQWFCVNQTYLGYGRYDVVALYWRLISCKLTISV